jgi:hypothetical protein
VVSRWLDGTERACRERLRLATADLRAWAWLGTLGIEEDK